MSVCLSVRSHISKTTCPNFAKFSVGLHVTCGSGLACNVLCTFGFEDDVMFSHNVPNLHRLVACDVANYLVTRMYMHLYASRRNKKYGM